MGEKIKKFRTRMLTKLQVERLTKQLEVLVDEFYSTGVDNDDRRKPDQLLNELIQALHERKVLIIVSMTDMKGEDATIMSATLEGVQECIKKCEMIMEKMYSSGFSARMHDGLIPEHD